MADSIQRAAIALYDRFTHENLDRRAFMAEALGIELHPDVLPFSNIPAWLPPFLLRPQRVMALAG